MRFSTTAQTAYISTPMMAMANRPAKVVGASLRALADSGCVRTPRVLHHDHSCLLMEYIPPQTPDAAFWRTLGTALARLHARFFGGDLALVKAWKGDRKGNLVYRKTARNFNPVMATAATHTIAEVEELVEPGALEADLIHTPGIFVKRIIQGASYEKRIEKRITRHG